MKRLTLLAAALLALAAGQVGRPHKADQTRGVAAMSAVPERTELARSIAEAQNLIQPSPVIMVFGPPPPPPTVRIPPPELWQPAQFSDDELAQALREITELMRGMPSTAPPVEP